MILIFILVVLLLIFMCLFMILKRKYPRMMKLECTVITLPKNENTRLKNFLKSYNESTIKQEIKVEDGVDGRKILLKNHVHPETYNKMIQMYKNKKRTEEAQLTPGMIGCYLSHMKVLKKFIEKNESDYLFVFEDDAIIYSYIDVEQIIKDAPRNWDLLLVGYIRYAPDLTYKGNTDKYIKISDFWGMHGYIVNKRSAPLILANIDVPITKQVDHKISDLCADGTINTYGLRRVQVKTDSFGTDVQLNIAS